MKMLTKREFLFMEKSTLRYSILENRKAVKGSIVEMKKERTK